MIRRMGFGRSSFRGPRVAFSCRRAGRCSHRWFPKKVPEPPRNILLYRLGEVLVPPRHTAVGPSHETLSDPIENANDKKVRRRRVASVVQTRVPDLRVLEEFLPAVPLGARMEDIAC